MNSPVSRSITRRIWMYATVLHVQDAPQVAGLKLNVTLTFSPLGTGVALYENVPHGCVGLPHPTAMRAIASRATTDDVRIGGSFLKSKPIQYAALLNSCHPA